MHLQGCKLHASSVFIWWKAHLAKSRCTLDFSSTCQPRTGLSGLISQEASGRSGRVYKVYAYFLRTNHYLINFQSLWNRKVTRWKWQVSVRTSVQNRVKLSELGNTALEWFFQRFWRCCNDNLKKIYVRSVSKPIMHSTIVKVVCSGTTGHRSECEVLP